MEIGSTFLIALAVIIFIWIFVEVRRFRHKTIVVIILLFLILTCFGFSLTIKDKELNLKTIDGIKDAGQLYFYWLGNTLSNLKPITTNTIKMEWETNTTELIRQNIQIKK
jgi:predicted tellurium resistance membrane protein TerC